MTDNLHQNLTKLKRSPKLEGIYELYRAEIKEVLKNNTYDRQRKAWLTHFGEISQLRLDRLSPLEVQKILLQKSFDNGHYHTVCYLTRVICSLGDFAAAVGIIDKNPLITLPDLPIVKKARHLEAKNLQHRPTLDYQNLRNELKTVIKTFESCTDRQRLLLEVSLRTILRPGETVTIKISNLDIQRHQLKVENTKTKTVFIIPTTESFEKALLMAYVKCGDPKSKLNYIFAGVRTQDHHLSPQTLNKALKDHGFRNKLVAHGIRSIAANYFAKHDSQVPPYVAEACLQHACPNAMVVKAYRRDDYLRARRKAMQLWNEWLDGIYAEVRKK